MTDSVVGSSPAVAFAESAPMVSLLIGCPLVVGVVVVLVIVVTAGNFWTTARGMKDMRGLMSLHRVEKYVSAK